MNVNKTFVMYSKRKKKKKTAIAAYILCAKRYKWANLAVIYTQSPDFIPYI